MTQPEQIDFGTLQVTASGVNVILKLVQLAYSDAWSRIHLLSVVGPQSAIKALSALLSAKANYGFKFTTGDDSGNVFKLPDGGMYGKKYHRLAFNKIHALYWDKSDDFMPDYNEEALWRRLSGPRFTTPMLREWMPYVRQEMEDSGLVSRMKCFQCDAAALQTYDDSGLDSIVSAGLVHGKIVIPEGAQR